ncbi:MAG TPA: PDZ domain-containing protein [Gemmatimonadales bacterium]|nr:PDZ domain-containing protein [Gemmatimonadales bacterium]
MKPLAALCALSIAVPSLPAQTPLRTYSDGFVQRYARTAPKVDYTVTVRERDRTAYFLELAIANPPNPARLVIPNWAPGAYRPMDSGKNIAGVAAFTDGGDSLPVTRESDIAWLVETRGAAQIVVRYAAGLRDPRRWARPNNRWFLRRTSGLIDGPRTFMYLDGSTLAPSHVRLRLPAGWGIATGLVATTDPGTYWAPSYDVLIDSPILVGTFVSYRFAVGGVPHRAVVDLGGAAPGYNERAFVNVLRRIAETAIGVFGNAPYKDYTFIFAGAGGGLEHLNSTTIGFSPTRVGRDPAALEEVTAHELFHAWNVKRIRPLELGPFDYTRPVRSPNLWMSEGVTDYYTLLILVRSGLDSPRDFARKIAASIASHHTNPARLTVSPERASWTVWDGPEVNDGAHISYYLQGELLGFLLDLAIRDSTDNARSLDDVMRYLFDHYAGERGFTNDDLVQSVRAVTGRNFSDFWHRYVSGTNEIPWNEYLKAAGWQVEFHEERGLDARVGTIPPAVQDGPPRAIAFAGSAAEAAGLKTGDELLRVNGRDVVESGDVTAALRGARVGDPITVVVRRDGGPLTIRFRAGTRLRTTAALRDLPELSDKMRRVRAGTLTGR